MLPKLLRAGLLLAIFNALCGFIALDKLPQVAPDDLNDLIDLTGEYKGVTVSPELTFNPQPDTATIARLGPGTFKVEQGSFTATLTLLRANPWSEAQTYVALGLLDIDGDGQGPALLQLQRVADEAFALRAIGGESSFEDAAMREGLARHHAVAAAFTPGQPFTILSDVGSSTKLLDLLVDERFASETGNEPTSILFPSSQEWDEAMAASVRTGLEGTAGTSSRETAKADPVPYTDELPRKLLALDQWPAIDERDINREMAIAGDYRMASIGIDLALAPQQEVTAIKQIGDGLFEISEDTWTGRLQLLNVGPAHVHSAVAIALFDIDTDLSGPMLTYVSRLPGAPALALYAIEDNVGFNVALEERHGVSVRSDAGVSVATIFGVSDTRQLLAILSDQSLGTASIETAKSILLQTSASWDDQTLVAALSETMRSGYLPSLEGTDATHSRPVTVAEEPEPIVADVAPTQRPAPMSPLDDRKRVALVIGNEAYTELPSLQKALADAQAFSRLLEGKGFDVVYRENATRAEMDFAIGEFLGKVEPGTITAVFYAGHGWSDGRQNFLLGVDAPFAASAQMQERVSIPVQNGANGIVDELTESAASLSVVILDACRDNPFSNANRGLSRGLVVQEPPRGTFVVFSAGAGQSALDRLSDDDTDPNSVFTRTIIPLLEQDLPLIQVVKAVQEDVYDLAQTVGHEQEPAYYDQVRGTPCLTGTCAN